MTLTRFFTALAFLAYFSWTNANADSNLMVIRPNIAESSLPILNSGSVNDPEDNSASLFLDGWLSLRDSASNFVDMTASTNATSCGTIGNLSVASNSQQISYTTPSSPTSCMLDTQAFLNANNFGQYYNAAIENNSDVSSVQFAFVGDLSFNYQGHNHGAKGPAPDGNYTCSKIGLALAKFDKNKDNWILMSNRTVLPTKVTGWLSSAQSGGYTVIDCWNDDVEKMYTFEIDPYHVNNSTIHLTFVSTN
jgi:hypothetical protein